MVSLEAIPQSKDKDNPMNVMPSLCQGQLGFICPALLVAEPVRVHLPWSLDVSWF